MTKLLIFGVVTFTSAFVSHSMRLKEMRHRRFWAKFDSILGGVRDDRAQRRLARLDGHSRGPGPVEAALATSRGGPRTIVDTETW